MELAPDQTRRVTGEHGAPGDMMIEELEYRPVAGLLRLIFCLSTILTIFLVLNQLLNWQLFSRVVILENSFLFMLVTTTLPLVFLAYPAFPTARRDGVPVYDMLLFAVSIAVGLWFFSKGQSQVILNQGWEYAAPPLAIALSAVYSVLILEALRRTGGWIIMAICLVIGLYPVVAESMPGIISGKESSLTDTIAYHIISSESVFGVSMQAFGQIVVGFLLFGVALNYTGGGKFFNDIAFATVGRFRGGAAQVGVISSMLQGSISGSVISNVISSGVVTIPAMKRTGFSPTYAAGVEAVASTGGVLMPPVMGSTAFVMASFLNTPYADIALAALVPGLLFYFGLAIQIDAYAARQRLGGMRADEIPSIRQTMKEGWVYILVFAVLVYLMLDERSEALAPFYATGVLLVINQILPAHRMSLDRFLDFIAASGRAFAELVAILTGVGFLVGAFYVTGLAGTLANDLVFAAGNNVFVLLIMGALTSFIFGMGMTATPCYIFLAIILAPALEKGGLDRLAIHLFIFYWGMVSFITPPVALAAFSAASIAKANQFAVGWESMKLGSVIYFVPFFFVLNPALILHGTTGEVVYSIATAAIGICLIAAALQGYLIGFGAATNDAIGAATRLLLGLGGLLLAAPASGIMGLQRWHFDALALALAAIAVALLRSRAGPVRVKA